MTDTPIAQTVPAFIYGTAWKEDRTTALVDLAIRSGFRAIDTANQRKHYFEAGVGQALATLYAQGFVTRAELFLQTKFTYQAGQDERLPYDPHASLAMQVEQSMASSLEHLGTDCVDSFLLHGPSSGYGWTPDDTQVWTAMVDQRNADRTRLLGVSNVSLQHLEQLSQVHDEAPSFVQNRCYARRGWDREVRAFCAEHNIIYQGFSLLTANAGAGRHPLVHKLAAKYDVTPAQILFNFAQAIGMLPLTGTTSAEHMVLDLASGMFALTADEINSIESIEG
ncbi:MAG: aldo/keto reductase [Acidobacteriota bacterium]